MASRHHQRAVPQRKVRGINVQEGESVLLVARPALAAVWPKYLMTLGRPGSRGDGTRRCLPTAG